MAYPTYSQYLRAIGVPMHRTEYKSFLTSRFWWACKQKALSRDGHQCRNCASKHNLEVHHLSYKHHGDELNHLEDLVTLCHACHATTHGISPDRRKGGLEHISVGVHRVFHEITEELQGWKYEQPTCLQSPQTVNGHHQHPSGLLGNLRSPLRNCSSAQTD